MRIVVSLYCLLCWTLNSLAQDRVLTPYTAHEVIHFVGYTYANERFFGIAPDRKTANQILKEYSQRNRNTSHRLTYKKISAKTLIAPSTIDVVAKFLEQYKKGYAFLSITDYETTLISKNENRAKGITYYIQKKKATPEVAKDKVALLMKRYASYIDEY